MYYCKDSNINYYKHASLSKVKVVQQFENIDFWKILKEILSYLFSTFLLALFLIIGYLSITKQQSILYSQVKYLFSSDSEFYAKRYTRYMVKSQKNLLEKQDIARIDKILTNYSNNKIINKSTVKRADNVRTIVVKKGDTLYTLAERAYGNASYYRLIFDANPKKLKSKKDLKIGQVLRVPF